MQPLFGGFVNITVSFRPQRTPPQTLELPDGATVKDALDACKQPVDGTLTLRAGVPIADTATLQDGDELSFVSSFSGG